MAVQEIRYRGYVITYDEVGADIWWEGIEWVTAEPTVPEAKQTIDGYLEAS